MRWSCENNHVGSETQRKKKAFPICQNMQPSFNQDVRYIDRCSFVCLFSILFPAELMLLVIGDCDVALENKV